ncbi:tRNA dimethylallyltransferase [Candidatus Saccharibacteria bacterium]|nr:MAG: tRNA dimethylallyltransferase [Candidatus Saccharibacteria bacterium]
MATAGIRPELPLIVIVGPTASGKTGLAIKLAKEFGGEIISADSRAIYRGLDIGTAKPSIEERQGITHWGIDLVDPSERFTAADFQAYANRKIAEIRARGRVPFLVGGTGLYIDAVVYNFEFPKAGNNEARRAELSKLSIETLHEYCKNSNVDLPENKQNKRYVIAAILRAGNAPKRLTQPISNAIIVGITTEKSKLHDRISERSRHIFTDAVIHEAQTVANKYGWGSEAMTGNIYPLIRQYLAGELALEQAVERFVVLDRRLAKRQLTWFKRSEHIVWLSLDKAYTYIARLLVSLNNS